MYAEVQSRNSDITCKKTKLGTVESNAKFWNRFCFSSSKDAVFLLILSVLSVKHKEYILTIIMFLLRFKISDLLLNEHSSLLVLQPWMLSILLTIGLHNG